MNIWGWKIKMSKELAEQIKTLKDELVERAFRLEELKYNLHMIEETTMSQILGEYDAHGKSVFANAESRNAEKAFRLDKNIDYKTLLNDIRELSKNTELLKNTLNYNERLWDLSLLMSLAK
jgi:hypothetical protein